MEDGAFAFKGVEFDHKPTLSEIKNAIVSWYNTQIDKEILEGFKWKDIPVWLSTENQLNYKAAYDIAVQTNGMSLPTFKLGTDEGPIYYKFESLGEIQDFYIKAMKHVTDTLSNGWQSKDAIDWTVYEALLK